MDENLRSKANHLTRESNEFKKLIAAQNLLQNFDALLTVWT